MARCLRTDLIPERDRKLVNTTPRSYKSSAESSSWRVTPSIRTYRREVLLKTRTNMRFTVLAAIASAALVAGTPVR